jgi:hypothetical protein
VALLLPFCYSLLWSLVDKKFENSFAKKERLNTTHFDFSGKEIIALMMVQWK